MRGRADEAKTGVRAGDKPGADKFAERPGRHDRWKTDGCGDAFRSVVDVRLSSQAQRDFDVIHRGQMAIDEVLQCG